jgi:hypothetical protein
VESPVATGSPVVPGSSGPVLVVGSTSPLELPSPVLDPGSGGGSGLGGGSMSTPILTSSDSASLPE